MSAQQNAGLMLAMLRMIEQREFAGLRSLYHPNVEFHWPPGTPYSGSFRGSEIAAMGERFATTWLPLQPTPATRQMDGRVLAAGDDGRVVVNYICRGLDQTGRRFETETLADYMVQDHRLLRAQMFYFDLPGLIAFLEAART